MKGAKGCCDVCTLHFCGHAFPLFHPEVPKTCLPRGVQHGQLRVGLVAGPSFTRLCPCRLTPRPFNVQQLMDAFYGAPVTRRVDYEPGDNPTRMVGWGRGE